MRRAAFVAIAAAGILGAAGVALAALAAHGGHGPNLATASQFLLFHAAALPGLAAFAWLAAGQARPRLAGMNAAAALTLGFGSALFAGDLAAREFWRAGLFPLAAPVGGMALIAGWALAALAGACGAIIAGKREI